LARPVALRSVGNLVGINALVADQFLSFGERGLTLVYGDNACGKSGYARLIKNMVRARHRDQAILPNVFGPHLEGSAAIDIMVGSEQRQIAWPTADDPDLLSVRFFDNACRDAYVAKEAEATYRPAAAHLLEALIRALDGVRAHLDWRASQLQVPVKSLPRVKDGTPAAAFILGLTHSTTALDIDTACALPAGFDEEIERLRVEEGRLLATDLEKERGTLTRLAGDLSEIAIHITSCAQLVNEDVEVEVRRVRDELAKRSQAAALAAEQFGNEAVQGVGSQAWCQLWETARMFAATQTHDLRTPCAVNEHCVLCQQPLEQAARKRLVRFEEFVADETQRQVRDAQEALRVALRSLSAIEVRPATIQTTLARVAFTHRELIAKCVEALNAIEQRRDALVDETTVSRLATEPELQALRHAIADVQHRVTEMPVTGFDEQILVLRSEREDLEARKSLTESRTAIFEEVQRLQALERIERAKTDASTNAVTRKAIELTRTYVTEIMRDRFTRETDRLKLERVTLKDLGGQKGTLRHQPSLLGAMQKTTLPQVLSEGEQTALGLAGFFTEVALDGSASAIVLDDPVCSLDHVRRGNVANRLCEFAAERQVIVFTHDLSFVTDLQASAERLGVDVVERAIERRGTKEPGVCRNKHPWKAKDAGARLNDLQSDLARMRKAEATWDQDMREREISDWAGRVSETWERLVNHEVAGQLFELGSQEVRPAKFKVFARVTEQDDTEFQTSYTAVSRWARRHDKSVALNYVPPSLDEMEKELAAVKTWFARVKKYRD